MRVWKLEGVVGVFSVFRRLFNESPLGFAFVSVLVVLVLLSVVILGRQSPSPPPPSQVSEASPEEAVPPVLELAAVTFSQNGEIALSAQGFAPGETVSFSVGDGQADGFKEVGKANADGEGQVQNWTVKLPEWVTSGARVVQAQGLNSGRNTEAQFYVRADKPWIDMGSYAAKQDSKLSLIAGGFMPSEQVDVFFEQGSQNAAISVPADLAGNIPWTDVEVRGMRPGDYNLILLGETSQIKVPTTITISPRNPWVGLHTYTIGPGGSIGFDATDFAPGERVQSFLDEPAGKPVAEAIADDAGNFTVDHAYTASSGDVGHHRLIFVGELTTENVTAAFDVIPFTPAFQMTVYSGPPGTDTSFNGYGFAPNETIQVFMQGQEQPMATITTDENGSFEDAGRFMVPRDAHGGDLGITLVGESSGARLTQGFSVIRIQPFLGFDLYAGPPGSTVRFLGLGFAAGETVTIHLGNREGPALGTVVADADGRFEGAVPYTVSGDATQDVSFMAIGESSGAEANAKFQVILPTNER